MYKLVIADDEKNICDGICVTIESDCPEVEITGVFYDGNELLEYLKNNPIDILICDICMQNISGLDIAAFIAEHSLNTHVILITGYRLFEYAHQAIKYHVNYFLTKPFSSIELVEAIKKIEQEIDTNIRNSVCIEKSMRHDWNIARQNVQKLYNGTWDSLNSPIQDLTCLQSKDVCIYEISYILVSDLDDTEKVQVLLEEAVDDIIQLGEFQTPKSLCIYCGSLDGELHFVSFCDRESHSDISSDFISEMSSVRNLTFNSNFLEFSSLKEYYYFCKSRRIFNELLLILSNNHSEMWDMLLDVTLASCTSEETSALLEYVISNFGEYSLHNEKDKIKTIKHILSNIQPHFSKTDALVNKAISYIQETYCNANLSRDMIADHLAVSASHLSRAFSNIMGQSLSSFILKTRMEKAKELLIESSLSTTDIAIAVGYNDPSYFKRSFKTYTGITPTKYKNIKR